MPAITPNADHLNALPPLSSRNVDVESLPWTSSGYDGIDMKVLIKEPETGLFTALFRWAPGTSIPLHEHIEIEQSYVLSGALHDPDGITTAGNFVWRPKGHQHRAFSPDGCLLLAIFLKPNLILEGDRAGTTLE